MSEENKPKQEPGITIQQSGNPSGAELPQSELDGMVGGTGGAGAGKIKFNEITVSKRTDTSSSDLF